MSLVESWVTCSFASCSAISRSPINPIITPRKWWRIFINIYYLSYLFIHYLYLFIYYLLSIHYLFLLIDLYSLFNYLIKVTVADYFVEEGDCDVSVRNAVVEFAMESDGVVLLDLQRIFRYFVVNRQHGRIWNASNFIRETYFHQFQCNRIVWKTSQVKFQLNFHEPFGFDSNLSKYYWNFCTHSNIFQTLVRFFIEI